MQPCTNLPNQNKKRHVRLYVHTINLRFLQFSQFSHTPFSVSTFMSEIPSSKKVKLNADVNADTMEIDDGLYSRQRYVLVRSCLVLVLKRCCLGSFSIYFCFRQRLRSQNVLEWCIVIINLCARARVYVCADTFGRHPSRTVPCVSVQV